MAALETELTDAKSKVRTSEALIEEYVERTEALENRLELLNTELAEVASKLSNTRDALVEKEQEVTSLCENLAAAHEDLEDLSQVGVDIMLTSDFFIQQQRENQAVKAELVQLKAASDRLSLDLEAVTTERTELLEKLEAAQLEHQKETKLQQQRAAELKKVFVDAFKQYLMSVRLCRRLFDVPIVMIVCWRHQLRQRDRLAHWQALDLRKLSRSMLNTPRQSFSSIWLLDPARYFGFSDVSLTRRHRPSSC